MGERKNETYSCHKTIQRMINFDDAVKENIKKRNPNWPQISDHPYRILIIGNSEYQKQIHYLI